LNLANKPFGST